MAGTTSRAVCPGNKNPTSFDKTIRRGPPTAQLIPQASPADTPGGPRPALPCQRSACRISTDYYRHWRSWTARSQAVLRMLRTCLRGGTATHTATGLRVSSAFPAFSVDEFRLKRLHLRFSLVGRQSRAASPSVAGDLVQLALRKGGLSALQGAIDARPAISRSSTWPWSIHAPADMSTDGSARRAPRADVDSFFNCRGADGWLLQRADRHGHDGLGEKSDGGKGEKQLLHDGASE